MTRGLYDLGRVAALLVISAGILTAQGTQTASLTGEVIEKGGAALDGAIIRLTSPSLQGTRVVMTNAKGRFIARLLPPGTYTITIEKEGYTTVKHQEKLGLDQNFQPRFTLAKIAGATVEVVGAPPAVDKTDVKTASNYLNETVDLLPQGRSMESVALLTPGVVTGVGGRIQVRGAMTSGNLMLVDGQNVQDNVYGDRGISLIDDAMEETQVITGAISAEYGSVDGGVINTISKSGGNEFHGQIRFNLSNAAWDAIQPFQDRSKVESRLNESKTATLGGFIIKDKLWFNVSFYSKKDSVPQVISGDSLIGPEGANTGYTYSINETRRQAKLTWLINQNHTLVYAWMNSQNAENNRDYSAGELAALIPQRYKDDLWNLAWRAIWNTSLTTDIRFGQKKQHYTAGATGNQSPIVDYETGYFFNNGSFNGDDGGDKRENKTFNAKASMFWDGLGSHQTDAGLDWYTGTISARNDLSPTSKIFYTSDMSLADRTATPLFVRVYTTAAGKAEQDMMGMYFNDKWSLNEHLSLQLGLRYDSYKAKDEAGAKTAGASGVSPRLGLKYDLLGDSKWIVGGSYAKYNGKVLENITSRVTNQGNPTVAVYGFTGTPGSYTFDALQNMTYYPQTPDNLGQYSNPKVNVRLNDKLKAQNTDEYQASLAHTFSSKWLGDGFLSLTYVKKKWNDLVDYSVGNNGTVYKADLDRTFYLHVWDNCPEAKREYKGLELAGELKKGSFTLTGNVTWSELKGNYEGEGSSSAGTGEGINAWTVVDGVRMFNSAMASPYGYLEGHVPLRMRFMASYLLESALGKTSFGLVYRFDSGRHYSDARLVTKEGLNPLLPDEAPDYFPQYRNNERGMTGTFPSEAYLDLAITHDWAMFKVADTPVRAFVKLTISNLFNHQQQIAWNTNSDAAYAPSDAWNHDSRYGKAESADYFGSARSVGISCGIRF